MFVRLAAALFAVLCAFASPARASSPNHPLFQPPAGWHAESLRGSRASVLGTVRGQWVSFARGDEEFIEIGTRMSYGFDPRNFAAFYHAYLAHNGERIYAFHQIALCNGESGWYIKHREQTFRNAHNVENVIFVNGSRVYFVTYDYPQTLPASPAAERAMGSLCVPNPVHAAPVVLPVGFKPPDGYLLSNPRQTGEAEPPGIIAFFYDPNHPLDVLFLTKTRAEGEVPSPGDAAAEKKVDDLLKRENVHASAVSSESFGIQPLCGSHIGWLSRYVVKFTSKQSYAYERMLLFGDTLYSAIYIRPAKKQVYTPARAALSTLCPIEPSPSPSASPTPSPSASPSPSSAPSPR